MLKNISPKTTLLYSAVLTGGSLAGFFVGSSVSPEDITAVFSETAQNQIAQAGFFFAMAAWIHSGRVKKEIKANFEILTNAINNVADSLREDLRSQSGQINNLSGHVSDLSTRVTVLENQSVKGDIDGNS